MPNSEGDELYSRLLWARRELSHLYENHLWPWFNDHPIEELWFHEAFDLIFQIEMVRLDELWARDHPGQVIT